jgi:hypothetical protein
MMNGRWRISAPVGLYVLWCIGAYALLLSSDWHYGWHVLLHVLALFLLWKPAVLRPRRATATAVYLVLIGTVYTAFVGEPLALLVRGDLHPNLLVNGFLWIGSFAGAYLAWAWLLARGRWHPVALFFLCGLLALFDHSLALWKMAYAGAVRDFLVFAPVLHLTYASMLAPVVIAYRTVLEKRNSPPNAGSVIAAVLLPGVLFRLGSLWIPLARAFIEGF